MQPFETQVHVLGHKAWPKKDRSGKAMKDEYGNAVIDYQIELGIAVGQPSFTVYIRPETAKHLSEATGNSFERGAEFSPYAATATFEHRVVSRTQEGSKYVNTSLTPVLRNLVPAEGRRRAAA